MRGSQTSNCLLAALWLCVKLRTVRLRVRIENRLPHFYVVDRDGQANYFRYVGDAGWIGVYAWWLWYRGRFVRLPVGKL